MGVGVLLATFLAFSIPLTFLRRGRRRAALATALVVASVNLIIQFTTDTAADYGLQFAAGLALAFGFHLARTRAATQ